MPEAEAADLIRQVVQEIRFEKLILTTPNADFNPYYELDGFRHDDHKWEMGQEKFRSWCDEILQNLGVQYEYVMIGDSVDGMHTTQGMIVTRKGSKAMELHTKMHTILCWSVRRSAENDVCEGNPDSILAVGIPRAQLQEQCPVPIIGRHSSGAAGYDYDKYDQVMLEASSHAFQLLFERLRLTTSFPIQADFVVVDTTALADDFRSKVLEIAHENNYRVEAILFDYRKREDYYASDRSKKLISTHISRLKKRCSPSSHGKDTMPFIKCVRRISLTRRGWRNPLTK